MIVGAIVIIASKLEKSVTLMVIVHLSHENNLVVWVC